MYRSGRIWRDESGAVAPIAAVALFALVGAAGLAFDYSRLAGLDSELQGAADQVALAAATQLDGKTGAQARATAAANSLITNRALFANDGANRDVTVLTINFYSAFDDASQAAAMGDADSNYVSVQVNFKTAKFALTPIVRLIASGTASGQAVAGVGSAICKVPPVMMCNPYEPAGNTDENYVFPFTRGFGLKLITGDATVPGNFGWLESNLQPGANALAEALGYNSPPGDCLPVTGVTTKPGLSNSVFNAFNTRFDIYANGNSTCPSQDGGTCSPSTNSRKDLVCSSNSGTTCQNSNGWDQSPKPYRPTTAAALPVNGSQDPDILGYPRDLCHALPIGSQTCGVVGDGNWDRDAYFRVNYGWTTQSAWMTATGLSSNATRYDAYNWEVQHTSVSVGGKNYGINVPQVVQGKITGFGNPATGHPGLAPSSSSNDRRRLSVAVLNCLALSVHGKTTNAPVTRWLDVFLVEPPFNRSSGSGANKKNYTTDSEIYAEVIGDTGSGQGGATTAQVVRRDVPYLLQ